MSYGICKICGCTDNDCLQCVKKSGKPCYWVDDAHDLCSVCEAEMAVNNLNKAGELVDVEKQYFGIIEDALKKAGGPGNLSKILNVNPVRISEWKSGKHTMSAYKILEILNYTKKL